MSDIFLSYRRDDEAGYVGRIADGLKEAFGNVVYRDVDSNIPGVKYKLEIQKQVSQSKVLIAVIGPQWQSILEERDPEDDLIRFELNLAHDLEIPVIPVRLRNAPIDMKRDLGNLNWLKGLHFYEMSDHQDLWTTDLLRLVESIVKSTPLEPVKQSDRQDGESPSPKWEKMAGFIFGVVFISLLLALNVIIDEPTRQQIGTFNTILAIAAAGVGGILAGFLHVEGTFSKIAIRTGGALALFVIIYFFNPAIPNPPPLVIPQDIIDQTISGDNGVNIIDNTGVINIGPVNTDPENTQP
jgi:hypothetical protein